MTGTLMLDSAQRSGARGSVLIVDDNPQTGDAAALTLRRAGYRTLVVSDAYEALGELERMRPDVAVVELMLPGMDGLELLRRIRTRTRIPVVLVTAHDKSSYRVMALRLGAEDCIVKPYAAGELLARVEAVQRRATPDTNGDEIVRYGEIELDPRSRRVSVRGRPVKLTVREYELLTFMARNPGKVFSRYELMSAVWGYTSYTDTATLSVHMWRLRSKIEDEPSDPRWLQTVRGVGYRFEPQSADVPTAAA